MDDLEREQAEIALKRAQDRAGSMAAIAEACDVTRQTVYGWDVVPAKHVLAVERLTGVSRHSLRPDIYPVEQEAR